MVYANELMLGNLVLAREAPQGPESIRKVVGVDIHGVWLNNHPELPREVGREHRSLASPELLFPITLSPQWLQRMGFANLHECWVKDEMIISSTDVHGTYHFMAYNKDGALVSNHIVFSVHRLQNLYFALYLNNIEIPIPQQK